MNSCWLPLVHTLALLRTWPCTLSYGIFSYTQPHTHTHMYSVLAHTSYTCGKQYTCLMMVQTLSLTNIVTCTCQFNCTCACLYRPLILCKFVYQAFCTCIVSPRIDYIVSPSGTLNVHKHCTLAHTHQTCTHTPLYKCGNTHAKTLTHNT